MTIGTLRSRQQTEATHDVSSAKDVRTIIANHLGVADDDVDQIDVVGDLIRHIAGVGNDRRRRLIVETPLR